MTALLRVGICLGIAFMLVSLLVTGDIMLFVNPRFKWLIALSILLLIILGLVQLWNLNSGEMHRIGYWGYSIVILPLFMFVFVPPQALDARIATKKGITYLPPQVLANQQKYAKVQPTGSQSSSQNNVDSSNSTNLTTANNNYTKSNAVDMDNPYKKLIPKLKAEPIVTFTDKNYADYMNTLNMYPEKFVGKKIRIMGFVYKDQTLKRRQFVTARFAVTCCTADASVVGFVTEYKNSSPLKENTWVEVTGTLKKETFADMGVLPVIELESYEQVSAPKDPYVYFVY